MLIGIKKNKFIVLFVIRYSVRRAAGATAAWRRGWRCVWPTTLTLSTTCRTVSSTARHLGPTRAVRAVGRPARHRATTASRRAGLPRHGTPYVCLSAAYYLSLYLVAEDRTECPQRKSTAHLCSNSRADAPVQGHNYREGVRALSKP